MYSCIPESFFNWNYRVEAAAAPVAAVSFNMFTEQGSIRCGGVEYAVRKNGWLSGEWTLELDGRVCARAVKMNPLVRKFEVSENGSVFLLKKVLMSRAYEIFQGPRLIGSIGREGMFTRRAAIDCTDEISGPGQLFCFWLAVLTWRRTARSNSGGS
jgi:hypothetical protein